MSYLEPKIDLVEAFREVCRLWLQSPEYAQKPSDELEQWLEDLQMWVPMYDPSDEY